MITMNGTMYQPSHATKSPTVCNIGINWPPRRSVPPDCAADKWLLIRYYAAVTRSGQEGARPISRGMVNRQRFGDICGRVDFAGRAHGFQGLFDDPRQRAESDLAV